MMNRMAKQRIVVAMLPRFSFIFIPLFEVSGVNVFTVVDTDVCGEYPSKDNNEDHMLDECEG